MPKAEIMNVPKDAKEGHYITETLQVHKVVRKFNEVGIVYLTLIWGGGVVGW